MDRSAEKILMPFEVQRRTETVETQSDDVEKGSIISLETSRLRYRILGIVAITIIPVFSVLFVLLFSVVVMYTLVPIPEIHLHGNISGVVNASLGTLGHAVLNPDVALKIVVVV